MPWASWRRNHKRPWLLPPNNEWGQVRPHKPEGNTLFSFAERGISYHLDCHTVSFLWGRPQLVTSGWVGSIPMSERGTLAMRVSFGLGWSEDPHSYSQHRHTLQEGFAEWQPVDFVTLFVIWSAQTRFTFHALPRAKVLDSFVYNPSTAANNPY
jgi:hypothetical protein